MKPNHLSPLAALFLVAAMLTCSFSLQANHNLANKSQLKYIENKGQWHPNVLYKSSITGQDTYLEKDGFTFMFYNVAQFSAATHATCSHTKQQHASNCTQTHISDLKQSKVDCHAINLKFLNAKTNITLETADELTARYNYFYGNNPDKWASDIYPAKSVFYRSLYTGVDLKVYSESNHFKYDLLVNPATANLTDIAIAYTGQSDLCTKNGELFITTSVTEAIELKPYVYQEINGQKVTVACNYLLSDNVLRFDFPSGFNPNYKLVIDPVLLAATYGSSSGTAYGHSATYGQNGEVFGAGRSFDNAYPTTTGAFQTSFEGVTDICISKFNEDATDLLYATYLGGSGEDLVANLITNSNNELVMLAGTSSSDMPINALSFDSSYNGGEDLFIAILSESGNALVGSTYLGGTGEEGLGGFDFVTSGFYGPDGFGLRGEIILGPANDIYVASYSSSSDFPTTEGVFQPAKSGGSASYDAVIAKFSNNLSSLDWATYLGGSSADIALGIRVKNNGEVLVVGGTESFNFPTTSNAVEPNYIGGDNDGFLCALSSDASTLLNGTFTGTSGDDANYFLDLDDVERVYVHGITNSGGEFPVSPSAYSEDNGILFVAAYNDDFSDYDFTTVLGPSSSGFGSVDYNPSSFAVDYWGKMFIGGFTTETGLTTTGTAWASNYLGGSGDFYFCVLETNAVDLIYGTYFGDSGWDHVDGGTCRFDKDGFLYQAVCTSSSSFPTTDDAYFGNSNGFDWDMAVFKFGFDDLFTTIPTACLEAKVYLEGAYNTSIGAMNATLWENENLPFTRPYLDVPWFYDEDEEVIIFPENTVDWLLLELRDANNEDIVVAQQVGLLRSDGIIMDLDGDPHICFFDVQGETEYYVVVRHRNHIDIMSSVPIEIPNEDDLYDFTTGYDPSKGYRQVKKITAGTYAMKAGDLNGNGVITYSDFNKYIDQLNQITLYLASDANLDGQVGIADYNLLRSNLYEIGIDEIRY